MNNFDDILDLIFELDNFIAEIDFNFTIELWEDGYMRDNKQVIEIAKL